MDVDKNWAWVVLGGAFIVNAISGGIIHSFGIIYIDFVDRVYTSSTETVAVGALSFACFCFVGPFARVLTKQIGYRLVTLLGSNIAFLGLLISAFVPTIHYHYVTFGGILGAGGGFIYIGSFSAVKDYFDRRMLIATTIFSCAIPTGLIVFAMLTRVFLDMFSYYGTFIVLSAIMLHGIVCALLFKPSLKKKNQDTTLSKYERMGNPFDASTSGNVSELPDNVHERDNAAFSVNESNENARLNDKNERSPKYRAIFGPTETTEVSTTAATVEFGATSLEYELEEKSSIEDEPDGNATNNTEVSEGAADVNTGDEKTPEVDKSETSSVKVDKSEPSSVKDEGGLITSILIVMFGIYDARVLCNWRLLLLLVQALLFSMGFGIPVLFYPDISRDYGSSDMRAAGLLSVIGVSMATGTLLLSFVSHKLSAMFRWSTVTLLCACLVICGVTVGCVQYYTAFAALIVSAMVFGTFSASSVALRRTILTEILGRKKIHHGLGLIYVISGVGFIIGLPIAGYLRDTHATYTWSFVMSAVCLATSGLVTLPLLVARAPSYEFHPETNHP